MASLISDEILDALEQRESSGNPKAYNKSSGAMGAYQFLPSTVEMMSKKHGSFDPWDRNESRAAAKQYLEDLVEQRGSLEGALAAYGGFKTKDPTDYINSIIGGGAVGQRMTRVASSKPEPNVFTVKTPDGRKFRVTGGADSTEDEALEFVKSNYYSSSSSSKSDKDPGFFGGIAKSVESLGSNTRTGIESLLGDPDAAARKGVERQKKLDEEYGTSLSLERLGDIREKEGLIAAAAALPGAAMDAIAASSPQFAASLGGGWAGAKLGSRLGPYGAVIGGLGGAGLALLPGQAGSNVQRQVQEEQPADIGKAYAYAVPQVAVDVVADRFTVFGKGLFSKMLGRSEDDLAKLGAIATERLAKESFAKSIVQGTVRGTGTQIPAEVFQQVLERQQAGLSLTSDDAYKEYGETAFQAALTGPAGIVGRRVSVAGANDIENYKKGQAGIAQAQADADAQAAAETSPSGQPPGPIPIPEPDIDPQVVDVDATEVPAVEPDPVPPPEEIIQPTPSEKPIEPDLSNTETVKPRLFIETDLKEMGITNGNKEIRGLLGANLSDPAEAGVVKSYLMGYAQDPVRSAKLAEKVINFHDKIDTYAQPIQSTIPNIPIVQPAIEPGIQGIEPQGVDNLSAIGAAPLGADGLASLANDVGINNVGEAQSLGALDNPILNPMAAAIAARESLINQDKVKNLEILDTHIKDGDVFGALNQIQVGDKGNISPTFDTLSKILAGRLIQSPNFKDVKMQMVESLPDNAMGAYDRNNDTIYMTQAGLNNPNVFLHESLHAAVSSPIDVHLAGIKNIPSVDKLNSIFNHVLDTVPELKYAYQLDDLHEFVNRSMTDQSFQKRIADIDYKKEGVVQKFVKSILGVFGVKPTKNQSALAESLVLGGELVSQGRNYLPIGKEHALTSDRLLNMKVTPAGTVATQFLDNNVGNITHAAPTDPSINDKSSELFFKSFADRDPKALKEAARRFWVGFRSAHFRKDAAIQEAVQDELAGEWRDANGTLRGDMLSSHASDYMNQTIAVLKTGGLQLGKSGFMEAVELPGKESMANSNEGIGKLGVKLGSPALANRVYTAWSVASRADGLQRKNPKAYSKMVGMPTDAQIQSGLQLAQMYPELKDIKNNARAVRHSLLDAGVQVGRFSQATADMWKDNLEYAPFFRVNKIDQSSDDFFAFKSSGNLADPATFKSLEGGFNEIGDMATNEMELVQWLTASILKNQAKLTIIDQLRVPLAKPGDEPSLLSSVYRDGNQEWYKFRTPIEAQTWRMSISKSNPIVKAMGAVANVLRTTIVVVNPTFSPRQLIDDTQTAMLMSGIKDPIGFTKRVFASFVKPDQGSQSDLFKVGVHAAIDISNKSVADMVEAMQNQKSLNAYQQTIKGLESWAARSDNAIRIGIYQQTLEETKSKEFPDGDQALAIHRARDIMNYSLRGDDPFVNTLATMVPFLHVKMQSIDQIVQALRGRGLHGGAKVKAQKALAYQAAKVAGMVALYSMAVGGSEDYKQLNDEEKWNNFIIPGTGFRLPVSPGLFSTIKIATETAWNMMATDATTNERDRDLVLKSGMDAMISGGPLNPLGYMPAAIKPIMEVKLNKNFFSGNDLISPQLKALETQLRYSESTSELAKMMSTASGGAIAPINADHLLRGYLGIVGTIVGTSVTMMSSDTPATEIKRMPLIKDFFYRTDSSGLKTKFYDLLEDVNRVNNTSLEHMKSGRYEDLEKIINDPKKMALLAQKGAVHQIEKNLSNYSNYRKMILHDKDLSPRDKRVMLTDIDAQETEMLKLARSVGIR